jgi:predicted nucleic acid-binding protein
MKGSHANQSVAGRKKGMADYLVAGVCLAHRGVLLTRNLDHFARVPDLTISGRYLERRG